MTQPQLPKPVFAKRKKSSKRRRRTEIPSPPSSPAKASDEPDAPKAQQLEELAQRSTLQHGLQRSQHMKTPRRPRGRVVRAPNLPFSPVQQVRPIVDYSALSLQRLRDAQTTRPPPASMVTKPDAQRQEIRISEPEPKMKLELQSTSIDENTETKPLPHKSQNSTTSRPAPFTAAWNPVAEPDEMVVDEEPDLDFLPTLEGSTSSQEGWEAAQLARGGGGAGRVARSEEQDYTHIIRRTEEAPLKKGDVTRLKAVLRTARREWETRESAAQENVKRATQAIESSQGIMMNAEREIEERKAVVGAYDDVLKVFRRVCEGLRREKEEILGYRERLLKRLDKEANEVKVRLLGGEDEFGRSVPGRLMEVDDEPDTIEDLEEEKLDFDAEGMMGDVINALNTWKKVDEEGYKQGFGAQGGGRMIGRLGLGLNNLSWLGRVRDPVMKDAAMETGEVARLAGCEIRALWEPRRENGLRGWSDVIGSVAKGVQEAARERFGWEVEACVTAGSSEEAEKCLRGGLELVKSGLDPGVAEALQKLREFLDENFCEEVEMEIRGIGTHKFQV